MPNPEEIRDFLVHAAALGIRAVVLTPVDYSNVFDALADPGATEVRRMEQFEYLPNPKAANEDGTLQKVTVFVQPPYRPINAEVFRDVASMDTHVQVRISQTEMLLARDPRQITEMVMEKLAVQFAQYLAEVGQ